MQLTVQCVCGATFTLNANFKSEAAHACPNCGRSLPPNMPQHIKDLFAARENLRIDCATGGDGEGTYTITVPGFTAPD